MICRIEENNSCYPFLVGKSHKATYLVSLLVISFQEIQVMQSNYFIIRDLKILPWVVSSNPIMDSSQKRIRFLVHHKMDSLEGLICIYVNYLTH